MITGRYQYRLPVGLEEPLAGRDVGLPPDQPTLPSLLKKAGYGTALVGKWHLGRLPKFGPLQSGYDHFYGFRGGAVDYYTHSNDLWDGDVQVHRSGYMTDLLGSPTPSRSSTATPKPRQPFLLSLHFNAPHWPWEAPGDEAESQRLASADSLADFDGGSQKTYERMIEEMDLQVGRVLDALHEHGLSENTIVVFTSDNGGERFADTWPFTGRKTELLEGGLRIPAIISWPARIPAEPGRTVDQVAITMDWLPTLLAAAGASPDPAFPPDGINLLPMLAHERAADPTQALLALQGQCPARGPGRRHEIPQDPRQHLPVQRRRRPHGTRQPERSRARESTTAWSRNGSQWNATMLPEIDASFTFNFTGAQLADHIGTKETSRKADNPVPSSAPPPNPH